MKTINSLFQISISELPIENTLITVKEVIVSEVDLHIPKRRVLKNVLGEDVQFFAQEAPSFRNTDFGTNLFATSFEQLDSYIKEIVDILQSRAISLIEKTVDLVELFSLPLEEFLINTSTDCSKIFKFMERQNEEVSAHNDYLSQYPSFFELFFFANSNNWSKFQVSHSKLHDLPREDLRDYLSVYGPIIPEDELDQYKLMALDTFSKESIHGEMDYNSLLTRSDSTHSFESITEQQTSCQIHKTVYVPVGTSAENLSAKIGEFKESVLILIADKKQIYEKALSYLEKDNYFSYLEQHYI